MDNRHEVVDKTWTAGLPTSYPQLRETPVTHKLHSHDDYIFIFSLKKDQLQPVFFENRDATSRKVYYFTKFSIKRE